MAEPSKSVPDRRRWFRFRLRTLFLVMTVIAVVLAFIGRPVHRAMRQQAAYERLIKAGATFQVFRETRESLYLWRPYPNTSNSRDASLIKWGIAGAALSDPISVTLPSSIDPKLLALLDCFSNLRILDLAGVAVTDDHISRIVAHRDLQWLTLPDTNLSSQGIAQLVVLDKLKSLDLDRVKITDHDLMLLAGLPQLGYLSIEATSVTKDGLRRFMKRHPISELYWVSATDVERKHLRALKRAGAAIYAVTGENYDLDSINEILASNDEPGYRIVLNNTRWRGSVAELAHLEQVPRFRSLFLHTGKLDVAGWQCIAKVRNLVSLELHTTPFTSPQLAALTCANQLKDLALTKIPNEVDLEFLASMPNIERLSLNDLKIGKGRYSSLTSLDSLQAIIFQDMAVSAADFLVLSNLKTLRVMEFSGTIDELGLEQLGSSSSLKSIDLWSDDVTDAGLERLVKAGGLTSLTKLRIASNAITDKGLRHLTHLPALEDLLLSSEQISENDLLILANCPKLKTLVLPSIDVSKETLSRFRRRRPDIEVGRY